MGVAGGRLVLWSRRVGDGLDALLGGGRKLRDGGGGVGLGLLGAGHGQVVGDDDADQEDDAQGDEESDFGFAGHGGFSSVRIGLQGSGF
ncbi:MAG: hypothetical protein AAGE65_11690 [Planctomycetota bacterium]